MTYEAAIAELNSLLEQLEQAPTDIDQLGERVQRASELIKLCRAKLHDLEVQLEEQ